jgi:renalase
VVVSSPVVVIGGGISGVACARRLHDAGIPVRILERSHRLGGRMAVRTELVQASGGPSRSHPVDTGAPYFTVRDDAFAQVVAGWEQTGRVRKWTDTFYLSSPEGRIGTTTSPLRWSSPSGLRGLVEDLADGLDVTLRHEVAEVGRDEDGIARVDGEPAAAVVLAMPEPQATRLLPDRLADELDVSGRAWVPAIAVWAAWPERWWPEFDAAFVDGSPAISWVADSGASHGDGAPVLCSHTTSAFAERLLDRPEAAIPDVLAALPGVLSSGSMPEPVWSRAHRWVLASPRHPHADAFAVTPVEAGPEQAAPIGVCGDSWGERSRVEQAWLSGDGLARCLVERLTID